MLKIVIKMYPQNTSPFPFNTSCPISSKVIDDNFSVGVGIVYILKNLKLNWGQTNVKRHRAPNFISY